MCTLLPWPVANPVYRNRNSFLPMFILIAGIALYPGKAELLTCKHHFYDYIPPLVNPGQPGEIGCIIERINYTDPFTNRSKVCIVYWVYSWGCSGPNQERLWNFPCWMFCFFHPKSYFEVFEIILQGMFYSADLTTDSDVNKVKMDQSPYVTSKLPCASSRCWPKKPSVPNCTQGWQTCLFKCETAQIMCKAGSEDFV